MRFRWKLLFLLLTIALIPLVIMRTIGLRAVGRLGQELVQQTRRATVSNGQHNLRQLMDSYSAVLWAGREQVETALSLQAIEVERCLAGEPDREASPNVYFSEDFSSRRDAPPDLNPSPRHFLSQKQDELSFPLVSYSSQVFSLMPGADVQKVSADILRLNHLAPVYKRLYGRLGELVLWHCTILETGVISTYPGHGRFPEGLDPEKPPWYSEVLAQDTQESTWSKVYVDPETQQVVLAAAVVVKRPGGQTAGVTAIVIPLSRLLEHRLLIKNIPPETRFFMSYVIPATANGLRQAGVFASDAYLNNEHRGWQARINSERLDSSDHAQLQAMLDDFETDLPNMRRMPYKGRDSLWVYGPVSFDGFLVLITPYAEILQPAHQAEKFIEGLIGHIITITGRVVIGIVLLVVILALAFSRTVTRPLQALAQGAQRLAAGHFDTRVDIRSKDEFGDMGRVFNAVGPRLKDHYQMRESLALAKEVQQNLLPKSVPHTEGLDIAGESFYCDETGGDYYDFLETDGHAADRIRVVVGDVSGHGIPSALLMTTARAFLRQRFALPGTIEQSISDINRQMVRDVKESGSFMTLFYCEIDYSQLVVRWVRAGHDPAMLYDRASDAFSELSGFGLPLGVVEDFAYESFQQPVAPGQIIVIGTDGIWEACNPQGRMFGKNTLQQIIRENAALPARAIISAVAAELETFLGPQKKEDDVTLVVVKIEA